MPEGPYLTLLRPGLELAWWVAKLGIEARPAIDPPRRLRPFMKAAKLPDRVLITIRQVVDEDDDFRARVGAAAEEEALGRAAWLWLVRPDGWEAEIARLQAEASSADSDKGQRAVVRQLERAQTDLVRTRAELAVLREANTGLQAAAKQDQQSRRKAETERDRLQTALQQARAEARDLSMSTAEVQGEVEGLTAAVDEAQAGQAAAEAAQALGAAEIDQLRTALDQSRHDAAALRDSQPAVDQAAAAAVGRAASAASELGAALAEVAAHLGLDAGVAVLPSVAAPDAGDHSRVAGSRRRRGRNRTQIPLPPAVFDDSVEAAAFLVRQAGILLVIDGYNVTLSSWPGLDLPDQRQRLTDGVAELTVRTGTTVHVVFDGVDAGGHLRPPPVARHRLRVEFSPSAVEADELIIDLIDQLDPARGAVVATNDRRVRDEVVRRGANVISVAQLLAVLGRGPADR